MYVRIGNGSLPPEQKDASSNLTGRARILQSVARKTQSSPFDEIRSWENRRVELGWWHSFELPDGSQIQGVCQLSRLKARIAQFPIPEDLRGKRVLDIGTWDGWFSFEMERRGAEVLAVDIWDNPRFREIHARLNSRVEYRQFDIYELTPDRVGRFDIVLFMGVLYHLKHPLLALERVCALTTDLAAVNSFVLDKEKRTVMEFYETDEFAGRTDNWMAPSVPCLMAFCRTAGFARVEMRGLLDHSASVACFRKWEPPSSGAESPELVGALHNANAGINFNTRMDEYVSVWFRSSASSLTLDTVKPEAGGYGVRPISLNQVGAGIWHANFKLPPGLTPGWHEVCVRIGGGPRSSSSRIAVDVPIEPTTLEILGVKDGVAWTPDCIDLRQGGVAALWIKGLPENADRNNLHAWVNGHRAEVVFIAEADQQPRQMNVQVPAALPPGAAIIEVALGNQPRASAPIEVLA
jgi:tRNA (mo5U34)-methyltransferase